MGWVGLEPTTNALKGRCSTIELPTRVSFSLYRAGSEAQAGFGKANGVYSSFFEEWQALSARNYFSAAAA